MPLFNLIPLLRTTKAGWPQLCTGFHQRADSSSICIKPMRVCLSPLPTLMFTLGRDLQMLYCSHCKGSSVSRLFPKLQAVLSIWNCFYLRVLFGCGFFFFFFWGGGLVCLILGFFLFLLANQESDPVLMKFKCILMRTSMAGKEGRQTPTSPSIRYRSNLAEVRAPWHHSFCNTYPHLFLLLVTQKYLRRRSYSIDGSRMHSPLSHGDTSDYFRVPPPWQCSRTGWMEFWATWSGGRHPCPWQEGWN